MSGLRARANAELEQHRQNGREFAAAGVKSFVLDRGEGDPVVLMHGVPASSFLYRKVAPAIAERGLRAIAFDLPGLGFAERPESFDYSWSGLGRFAAAAVDALELEGFHLVVHDIGGPVGFELASAHPDRVQSITILNTLIDVEGFRKPWVMRPFGVRGLGEAWLASMNPYSIVPLMWGVGVTRPSAVPSAELAAYAVQLKSTDRGRAFLKIMRGFEPTAAKARQYAEVVARDDIPVEILWGAKDPALPAKRFGAAARELSPAANYSEVPGRHFLQEEFPHAVAARVAAAAARAN